MLVGGVIYQSKQKTRLSIAVIKNPTVLTCSAKYRGHAYNSKKSDKLFNYHKLLVFTIWLWHHKEKHR